MIPDAGLNRIRDVISADLYSAKAGTGTNLPAASDTNLQFGVTASLTTSISTTASDKTLSVTYIVTPAVANGSDLAEWALFGNSGNTLVSRSLTAPITKDSATQVTKVTTLYIDRG